MTYEQRETLITLMLLGHWGGDEIETLKGTDAYDYEVNLYAKRLIKRLEKRYSSEKLGIHYDKTNTETAMLYFTALDKFVKRIGSLALDEFIGYAESLDELTPEK